MLHNVRSVSSCLSMFQSRILMSNRKIALALILTIASVTPSFAALAGKIEFAGFLDPVFAGPVVTGIDVVASPFGLLDNEAFVSSATGSFSLLPGSIGFYSDIDFSTLPISPLWSVGGFSFELTSLTVVTNDGAHLDLSGSGIVTDGVDSAPMDWTLTSTDASGAGAFNFFADSNIVVPESSALLPFGMLALVVLTLRRRTK